jgi:hypothetical protein
VKTRRYRLSEVESFPRPLTPGVLYVSNRFRCAAHACACGCGREVITPLSPVQWQLTRSASGASLRPSIGNWSFPCRSHYWITSGRVEWAAEMSEVAIREGREVNARLRQAYFNAQNEPQGRLGGVAPASVARPGWLARLLNWLARQFNG